MNVRLDTSPNAHRVLQHADDVRPAWLWSQDGQRLIWSNASASLFQAKLKKHGLKTLPPAVPIKGQVARIIRLGSIGRSSLARIQFLAGERPVSATCATTPLDWVDGETALLIVGVDPIADTVLEAARVADHEDEAALTESIAPGQDQPVDESLPDETTTDGARRPDVEATVPDPAGTAYARELQSWQDGDAEVAYDLAGSATLPDENDDDLADRWSEALGDAPTRPVAAEQEAGNVSEADVTEPQVIAENQQDERPSAEPMRLSDLVDRLAADEALYAPLGEENDFAPQTPPAQDGDAPDADEGFGAEAEDEPALYRIIGRGFVPLNGDDTEIASGEEEDIASDQMGEAVVEAIDPADEQQADAETVERVSRYNFDELSRILSDRVGDRGTARSETVQPPARLEANNPGALINLSGETLVLNRLPLGILVFRDQNILFANRAITEMVGYDSVDSLRQAGLAAVFPVVGSEEQQAGPVNHLVTRDGALVPVTARLQSTSWQGQPALMLSASTTEVRTGHEDAVKAFAQSFADIRGDGFVEAGRTGLVQAANAAAASQLGGGKPLRGQSLADLVGADDAMVLRGFLERPARFAETSRPCINLRSADGKADILLFALGQAGVISGYFGFVRSRPGLPTRIGGPADVDPALLARISRGVRRPLNTIIGFSDIIRSQAFGALDNERYEGYADDIARAGQEIAALVDELDDYARLRDGRYLPQRASLELSSLLESCVLRIRDQANAARVIVRNAISESLPRVTADRPSLAQAVLNLLASAIDQTPAGGAVVISAQRLDDGAIAIHVRDSSVNAVDMAERFVVFRDGQDRNGQMLAPVRSSVGLALTRSLLAVNAVSLSVDPAGPLGMLFTLKIPADLVDFRPGQAQ